jgi:hypothetical protein
MFIVAFAAIFAGVVSSVLAGATTALLLSFILPVSLAGPVASIPDRVAGWGLASGVSLLAITLLWPAPARDPLRDAAVAACRSLAARLRSDVSHVLGTPETEEHVVVVARADAAVRSLRQLFFATPYRPTGLSTATRMIVRLVDELNWLNLIVTQSLPTAGAVPPNRLACEVRAASAGVLESGADLLHDPGGAPDALNAAMATLREALTKLELGDTLRLPPPTGTSGSAGHAIDTRIQDFITSLDPSFRAQELSFVVSSIARNIDLAAAADRRTWLQRLLGRAPAGSPGTLSAAHARAGAHVERHSVSLHNSVRGGAGLALAVLVAHLTGVQHAFWVVFGTLSVLRSNALNTGQNVLRLLLGTTVGFVIGAGLVAIIGTNTTLLWLLLPVAVLLAGFAPAAISFAAGQAAFTLTLLILYNILEPAGWQIGLVRIEDVALGGAISLSVGLLLWPRGAGAALGTALGEAYTASIGYLAGAVEYGMARCDRSAPSLPVPTTAATQAAAAARRLDDTFRGYLAERGAKPIPLAEVTGLVNGVVGLRLAADAVLDLWERDESADGDRAAARTEILADSSTIVEWYEGFAHSLAGVGGVPEPLGHDEPAAARLLDAVSHDLRRADGRASATAARMIWTGDHLDAARRLQSVLVGPAQAVNGERARPDPFSRPRWLAPRVALR